MITLGFGQLNSELPFSDNEDPDVQPEEVLGVKQMLIPIFAGILSALRRVIARRVSLKVSTSFGCIRFGYQFIIPLPNVYTSEETNRN